MTFNRVYIQKKKSFVSEDLTRKQFCVNPHGFIHTYCGFIIHRMESKITHQKIWQR